MDAYLSTLIGALATWRATHLLHAETGPARVFERLRAAAGQGVIGQAIDCFYCLSLWVAAPVALLLSRDWGERALLWLGLSAAAIGLERVNGRWTVPAIASYFEEEPPAALPEPARSDRVADTRERAGLHITHVPDTTH
ncbi:hypothetical protein [Ideonella sp. BN130291]|uniref:hypothetical protein n=1 Tax=Ideonella sp. BN130291 TaxID=3112940 RepID=UPI002E268A90|nr:hypothetical protein [Ideonella sp. BN130291]